MQATQREKYREKLLDLRDHLRTDMDDRIREVPEIMKAPGEVSDLPTHGADHDVEGLAEEVAVGQTQEAMLQDVEEALDRIDDGTYGKCQQCGKTISQQRLNAIPYTPYCIECARQQEAG